jgi:hypothetical protein
MYDCIVPEGRRSVQSDACVVISIHRKKFYFSILDLPSKKFYGTPFPWVKRPKGTRLFFLLEAYKK